MADMAMGQFSANHWLGGQFGVRASTKPAVEATVNKTSQANVDFSVHLVAKNSARINRLLLASPQTNRDGSESKS